MEIADTYWWVPDPSLPPVGDVIPEIGAGKSSGEAGYYCQDHWTLDAPFFISMLMASMSTPHACLVSASN